MTEAPPPERPRPDMPRVELHAFQHAVHPRRKKFPVEVRVQGRRYLACKFKDDPAAIWFIPMEEDE